MIVLGLLQECSHEFGVTIFEASDSAAFITLDLRRSSGATVRYELKLKSVESAHVQVRERIPQRLPAQCPERHINPDGTFCMHWAQGDPRQVTDPESARDWWRLLWDFLERQEAAARLRRWPGRVRAHGNAARHQARAEELAARFGAEFSRDLDDGAFHARQIERRGRRRIELIRHGSLVNRLALPARTLTNSSVICPCDEGRRSKTRVSECGVHAQELAQLIDRIHAWHDEERRFNLALKKNSMKCCGSLQVCSLR
jgi:hypothetical protein